MLLIIFLSLSVPVAIGGPAISHGRDFGLHYRNPVFKRDFPDPMVLRLSSHDYYAYGTSTTWERTGRFYPILHSTDAVHWKYVGDALHTVPNWANNDFWAPDVVKHGSTYYLYYTATSSTAHVHCIGMATASSPRGPFRTRNTWCGDQHGYGIIDPDLYLDQDGSAYLYVSADGPPHTINVIRMQPDLLHPAGTSTVLFGVTQSWETGPLFSTVEGPFLIHHGSLYYLFYSGNSYQGSYAEGYAAGSSPTGPFTKDVGNPVLKGDQRVHGPGGGSVFTGPGNTLWMAYHARVGSGGTEIRNFRIDPLQWQGEKVSVPVHP